MLPRSSSQKKKAGRPVEFGTRKGITLEVPTRAITWLDKRALESSVSRNVLVSTHLEASACMFKYAELGIPQPDSEDCGHVASMDYSTVDVGKENEPRKVILLRLRPQLIEIYNDWAKKIQKDRRRVMVRELMLWMQMDKNLQAGKTGMRMVFNRKGSEAS